MASPEQAPPQLAATGPMKDAGGPICADIETELLHEMLKV